MHYAFYITFWSVIILLLILAFIYTYFAYVTIGEFERTDSTQRTLEARDYLLWTLILEGIGLGFLVLLIVYGIIFRWGPIYTVPTYVLILYLFFFIWFMAAIILIGASYERIGASINVLASKDLKNAKTDIVVAMASVTGIVLLLIIGYFGFIYQYEKITNCKYRV